VSNQTENTSKNKPPEEDKRNFWQRLFVRKGSRNAILLPLLAVFTALVVGAFFIAFSNPDVLAAYGDFFHDPLLAIGLTFSTIFTAYAAMFQGSIGNPIEIVSQLWTWITTGNATQLLVALRPLSESLLISVPYILAGLGVALGFQGNLFNIGAEGQLTIGALGAAVVGFAVTGLPWYIHAPLAILAGAVAAGLWGFIPGLLKARFGSHEVINTMMMNYIAFRLMDYLLNGPLKSGGTPATPIVQTSAQIATILPNPIRLHWGFFIALGIAVLVYWLLYKTTFGMEVRMVGQNDRAARYAGVSVPKTIMLTMAISGALCGLGGAIHLLGVDHRMMPSFSPGYGFDALALALLGNSNPIGVVLASLLFGFLRGGATRMQSIAGTPVEIIRIIQGLVIVFVAAPEIIRSLYRLRTEKREKKKKPAPASVSGS
jgi:general nucleoside transport system permease protein